MNRVTGLGGVFFKSQDPARMRTWYAKHLGIDSGEYGTTFDWIDPNSPGKKCQTAWNLFPADTKYFNPGKKEFMLNYRVENLKALMDLLRSEGVQVVGDLQEFEYGKFGWIMDPEGNKIELWEPVDEKSPEDPR